MARISCCPTSPSVSKLAKDVAALRASVSALTRRVSDLEQTSFDVAGVKASVDAFEDEMTAVQAGVAQLQVDLTGLLTENGDHYLVSFDPDGKIPRIVQP